MIRDLTKSAVSFSWALSLLTLKQAINLVSPGKQQGGRDLFSPMTQVAVGQLDESMKGFHRTGDSLQSRMVDMGFSLMNPMNWLNPNTWNVIRSVGATGNCGQSASGFSGQTAGAQPSVAPSGPPSGAGGTGGMSPAPVSNQSAATGWGPMP